MSVLFAKIAILHPCTLKEMADHVVPYASSENRRDHYLIPIRGLVDRMAALYLCRVRL